jgi:lipopolysaccharide heptosyltransferase II
VTAARKILIVGPSWIGDMVMAQSLYRSLRQGPGAPEVHVVAPPWSIPVLARMPEVTRAIELDVRHGELGLRKRYALGIRLRAENYDRAIVLPRSAKAALVPWFAQVRVRTGFRGEWRYGLLTDVRRLDERLDQTVKRFVALGEPAGAAVGQSVAERLRPALTLDGDNLKRLTRDLKLPEAGPRIALMPGAEYGPAKRWPLERFAEVGAALAAEGVTVLVLGSAKERALGDAVAGAGGAGVVNLCGRTELADAVDLLGSAEVAVTNDSGLMHIAAATPTRVVAIYGSSSPAFTPPLSAAADVLYRGVECSPCFERTCPLGHFRCMREITVEAVLAAVRAKLGASREIAEAAQGRGQGRADG